jgi:hypothetical protein
MRFIPTCCDVCSLSTLTAETSIRAGRSECAECGGGARTVPGSSYAGADRALYDLLADALSYAELAPLNAVQLLAQIDAQTLQTSPGRTLSLIARALPALTSFEAHFGAQGFEVRKAEGMLVTLLVAHATARRPSRLVPPMVSSTERAKRVAPASRPSVALARRN